MIGVILTKKKLMPKQNSVGQQQKQEIFTSQTNFSITKPFQKHSNRMNNLQTHHGLCNKLQKWMNLKQLASSHCQASHNQCSHSHPINFHQQFIMSSPYKKTSFETLLRKYPNNQNQNHQNNENKGSRVNFADNKNGEAKGNFGLKRTFQSRIMKYNNVKSRIDTNLDGLKIVKSTINDENKNTQNLQPIDQDKDFKLEFERLPIKKIKLNTVGYEKFKPNYPSNENDSQISNFQTSHMDQKIKFLNNKPLFKINVARKKINMPLLKFSLESQEELQNNRANYQNQQVTINERQEIPQLLQNNNLGAFLHSQTPLQNEPGEQNIENYPQEQSDSQCQELIHSKGKSKFIFRNLKDQSQQQENFQNQVNEMFAFDGYRILEERHEDEVRYERNQYQNMDFIHVQDAQQVGGQNYMEDGKQVEIKQIIEEKVTIHLEVVVPQNQPVLPESKDSPVEILEPFMQQLPKVQEEAQRQNNPQIGNANHSCPGLSADQQKFYKPAYIQKPKPKQQRPKKEKKSNQETKILTRAKEDKLNLFNKLSMRLLRKNYGYNLSHSQLADKLLEAQNSVQLRAFLSCNTSQKTIFNFKDLTTIQMKNILVKYFDQEEFVDASRQF